jgi:hypothetical protein
MTGKEFIIQDVIDAQSNEYINIPLAGRYFRIHAS